MNNKKRFIMVIHWLDNDTFSREKFYLKQEALLWFEDFKKRNKRAVVITFYCDVVPCWTYRKDYSYKTLAESDKFFRDGNVYFISPRSTSFLDNYDVNVYGDDYKYRFTIQGLKPSDIRMLRRVYQNVYYWRDEMEQLLPRARD